MRVVRVWARWRVHTRLDTDYEGGLTSHPPPLVHTQVCQDRRPQGRARVGCVTPDRTHAGAARTHTYAHLHTLTRTHKQTHMLCAGQARWGQGQAVWQDRQAAHPRVSANAHGGVYAGKSGASPFFSGIFWQRAPGQSRQVGCQPPAVATLIPTPTPDSPTHTVLSTTHANTHCCAASRRAARTLCLTLRWPTC